MTPGGGSDLRGRLARALGDGYVLGDLLGRGGFAEVWKALDVTLERDVAVKVLRPELADDPEVAERFLREARAMARMAHPHLVAIYGTGASDGLAWVVMQYVTGESLRSRLDREGPLPCDAARTILAQAAEALDVAHRAGIIHRDVKPDNILLERDGRVLLTDFGIARAREPSSQHLTGTGLILGTPHYMSPEQGGGESTIDARADIYSLGVVGFQLVAGRLPFEGGNVLQLLMKHATEQPPSLGLLRPDTPPDLVAAIDRCLRKRPDDRWGSAAEFCAALRRASGSFTTPPAEPAGGRGRVAPLGLIVPALLAVTGVVVDLALHGGGVVALAGAVAAGATGVHWWAAGRLVRQAAAAPATADGATPTGPDGPHRAAQSLRADRAALVAMLGRVPSAERKLLDEARRAMDDLVARADEGISRLDVTPRSRLVAEDDGDRRARIAQDLARYRAVGVELRRAVRRVWADGYARAVGDVERALTTYAETVRREA